MERFKEEALRSVAPGGKHFKSLASVDEAHASATAADLLKVEWTHQLRYRFGKSKKWLEIKDGDSSVSPGMRGCATIPVVKFNPDGSPEYSSYNAWDSIVFDCKVGVTPLRARARSLSLPHFRSSGCRQGGARGDFWPCADTHVRLMVTSSLSGPPCCYCTAW